MGPEAFIVVLIAFLLVAALIAVETRDLLSSVIALGAAGFALSVIDLLLGAPDLAITQVVVEVISLVLLVRLVVTRVDRTTRSDRDLLRTGLALLAAGVLLAAAYFAFRPGAGAVPTFGEPLMAGTEGAGVGRDYLARSAEQTGSPNAVMGILLDFRAYDTLGEATVIFVSILGAYAVLRRIGRHRAPAIPSGQAPGESEGGSPSPETPRKSEETTP